jgi:hypothetical protein
MSKGHTCASYLVECFWPNVSARTFVRAAQHACEAAQELRRQGRPLQFLGSILVTVDETVFYLFDGQEADVRAASERAGLTFERVLESLRIDGGQPNEEERCRQ